MHHRRIQNRQQELTQHPDLEARQVNCNRVILMDGARQVVSRKGLQVQHIHTRCAYLSSVGASSFKSARTELTILCHFALKARVRDSPIIVATFTACLRYKSHRDTQTKNMDVQTCMAATENSASPASGGRLNALSVFRFI
eukprot:6211517-Pleurochrysis_carterae.AAC.2